MIRYLVLVLILVGVLSQNVAAGETAQSSSGHSPSKSITVKLDVNKVVQLANKYANEQKIDLTRYNASAPRVTVIGGRKKWAITYFPKEASANGDHFALFIDDENQTVVLFPGA